MKTKEDYHEKALEKIETKNQKHRETHLTFFFFLFRDSSNILLIWILFLALWTCLH